MTAVRLNKPDDWHLHLRDGDVLTETVNATAQHFSRALVMPNLVPPVTTVDAIEAYEQRIVNALNPSYDFTPYFTLYLNESVTPETLEVAGKKPFILGAKLYPAGATTNSAAGAKSLKALYPLLDLMQQHNLVLQIHGEVTHGDIFDREKLFLSEELKPIVKNFPKLRIVLEHVSSAAGIDFVAQAPSNVAATITVHHLLYNRNHMLVGGIKPHYYCLPILKDDASQLALQKAVSSGNPKFFLGTDSAPHAQDNKETSCGCAGIYSAPYALPLYAYVFEQLSSLDKLNDFASHFGAQFYQLPINQQQCELVKRPQTIPPQLQFGNTQVIPIAAGETIAWSVDV